MKILKSESKQWIPDPDDSRFLIPEKWDPWVDGLREKDRPYTPRLRIDGKTRKKALKSTSKTP